MSGLIATLLPNIDSILGVRDSIGAVIQPVYFVTRTWFKDPELRERANFPEGHFSDVAVQMFPTPKIKAFSQDVRLKEGGSIKNGDLILENVSKNKYKQSDLDGSSQDQGIEKLFMVGVKVYQVINVTEKYVTFNVQIRELTKQGNY